MRKLKFSKQPFCRFFDKKNVKREVISGIMPDKEDVVQGVEGVMKGSVFLLLIVVGYFCGVVSQAASIPDQPGQDITCTGPRFTYQHDVRQHGVDTNLMISGDAGFVEETGTVYASYFINTVKYSSTAVFQYSFVAEPGAVLGEVSVASRAFVHLNAGTVTGDYRIGEGDWVPFLSLTTSGDIRPIDVIENVYTSRFTIRYTVSWSSGSYQDHVQLFRSSSSAPGQPGDYAFTFTASVITDIDCQSADIAGDDLFIDFTDFAALVSDYGLTESGLMGDIDNNGTCNMADLQWLASQWLCNCYMAP